MLMELKTEIQVVNVVVRINLLVSHVMNVKKSILENTVMHVFLDITCMARFAMKANVSFLVH